MVAEGVETGAQLDLLKDLGCDQYQGYCFSPAVPAPQFAGLLREAQQNSNVAADGNAERTHSKLEKLQVRN